MSRRGLAACLAVVASSVAAGACDEPPGIVCPGFCNDDDQCTVDSCDTETGECVFIPIDVANACRTDLHCDDGIDCTIDSCKTDPVCGLQRCSHEIAIGCQSCFDPSECQDGDPCSIETCSEGFCQHSPLEGCQRLCDETFDPPPDIDRIFARATPLACDCPCSGAVSLVTEGGDNYVLQTPGNAHCDTTCDEDQTKLHDCRPLAVNERWAVWGQLTGGTLEAEGWCPAPDGTLPRGPLDARLVLGGAVARFTMTNDEFGGDLVSVLPADPDTSGAPTFEVLVNSTFVELLEGMARRFQINFFDGLQRFRTAEMLVFPSPTGFRGIARTVDLNDAALTGTIDLVITPGPRPIEP